MPRAAKLAAKLKVYRTPIGFHDAYVAASSQKAALAAWGSDRDLFARGVAEIVTDPALTADPLAAPGKVIRRSRGTVAEQIAALPPDPPDRAPNENAVAAGRGPDDPRPVAKAKPRPKPSRTKLDAAEAALAALKKQQREELKALADREAALAHERRAIERVQADELSQATAAQEAEEAAYDAAVRRWRG